MLYPLVYLFTTSSLTLLLIFVGVFADAGRAADIALAQGAALASFYAFSANVRNLVLQKHAGTDAASILLARTLFVGPLCGLAYLLSVHVASVPAWFAAPIIVRRGCEWLGEVRLSCWELEGQRRAAGLYLAIQAGSLAALVLVFILLPASVVPALWAWAFLPLAGVVKRGIGRKARHVGATLRMLVPHLGSTMIIGISIYLLRLIVVLVTERAVAGVLFTAIAIGSFSGTLFGNVLGPSLALRRPHDERMRLLGPVLTAFVLLGAVFALAAPLLARLPVGKPALFWLTLGLSLAGSAVMIEAQRIRLQLFDASRGADLFGPDILRTMTLLIVAPAVAVFVGVRWLAGLYLLDAILTWVFYQSAARHAREQGALNPAAERVVQTAVAVLLLFPLFIQLIGAVYHSPELPMLDSGGAIRTLPLPISLVACFLGTVLLARFRQASAALAFVFFMFAAMALTSVIASRAELGLGSRKLLLLAQFLLPTFALILGQMFESGRASGITLARSFLWTLAIFVPLQLFLTLWQGKYVLTHEMVLFSVYQHRQYVPVIFVAAYLVALFTLWDVARERPLLIVLAVVMAIYAAVSYSTLALALLVLGAAFVLRRERASFLRLGAVAVLLATVALPLWYGRDKAELRQKYSLDYARTLPGTHIPVPENVSTRLRDWELYAGGTLDSVETALFGHAEPFERSASTSAHNYYFDFLYNFGLVGFLPFALLIGYTVWLIARNRHRLRGDFGTYGLAIVVLFLVLVDNNFKVTFRQPYPAVFSFFLWGLLLRRLRT